MEILVQELLGEGVEPIYWLIIKSNHNNEESSLFSFFLSFTFQYDQGVFLQEREILIRLCMRPCSLLIFF